MGEIGQRLRALREAHGWSQDELASRARARGLNWSRTTVAKLESGARDLTAEEFLLVAVVLDEPLAELIPEPTENLWMVVSPYARIRREALRRLARGARPHQLKRLVDFDDPESRGTVRELGKVLRRLDDMTDVRKAMAKEGLKTPMPVGEAEQDAAHHLGIEPLEVSWLAHRRWRRGLVDERERRLQKRMKGGESPASLQAIRGRIMRNLVTELQQALKGQSERSNQTARRRK